MEKVIMQKLGKIEIALVISMVIPLAIFLGEGHIIIFTLYMVALLGIGTKKKFGPVMAIILSSFVALSSLFTLFMQMEKFAMDLGGLIFVICISILLPILTIVLAVMSYKKIKNNS